MILLLPFGLVCALVGLFLAYCALAAAFVLLAAAGERLCDAIGWLARRLLR